jgi:hypothetical protein
MSLLSALKNTTYNVNLHTNLLPETIQEWNPYTLLVKYKDRLQIIFTEFEEEIEGVKLKPSLISDIYSIRILKEYGGLYSDLDMLWFKNLPKKLLSTRYVVSWENQSYKTVQNAFLYMEKGFPEADELLEEFKKILKSLKEKRKTDFSTSRKLKDHLTLYYATTAFSKRMCEPFHREHLFLNGWKRIGRICRRNNLPTKNPEQNFGLTQDKLNLKNICGLHWCNFMYYWSSIKQIPELKQFLQKLSEDCEGHLEQPLHDEHTQEHVHDAVLLHQEAVAEA